MRRPYALAMTMAAMSVVALAGCGGGEQITRSVIADTGQLWEREHG